MDPTADKIVRKCRETACASCTLKTVCTMAPIWVGLDPGSGGRQEHPTSGALKEVIQELVDDVSKPEQELLRIMGEDHEDFALAAGCLLATLWWEQPENVEPLANEIRDREEGSIPMTEFGRQVMRLMGLLQPAGFGDQMVGQFELGIGDGMFIDPYAANRVIGALFRGSYSLDEWWDTFAALSPEVFEASFVARESKPGYPSLDLFWATRIDRHTAIFYLRRDIHDRETMVSVDAIRLDSLIQRLFKVFDTDAKNTHHLFARMCRYINKQVKATGPAQALDAIRELSYDQMIILVIYAPSLAVLVEEHFEGPGFVEIIKVLHNSKGGWPVPPGQVSDCHSKVWKNRHRVIEIYESIGAERFKNICKVLFRVAAHHQNLNYISSVLHRLGEAAYFATAILGMNSKGLEMSLDGDNPLAFIGYGMQPISQEPEKRYQNLRKHVERFPGGPLRQAIEQGLYYLARTHAYDDLESFQREMESATN